MTSRLPEFHIAKIRPEQSGGMWVFASIGAWQASALEGHGTEFVAVAGSESGAVMEHVAMAAYYHAGPVENRLGVGHTVPIGESWEEGSALDVLLVTRPYIFGPTLEHCELPAQHVQVLWIIPISQAERALARRDGFETLEALFEESNVDYLDPFRPSLVKDGDPAS
jgi:hypothetical protein